MARRNEEDPDRERHERGVFERPKRSGIWWVRYHDEVGREHRERVGPKGLATKVYQKRKTEIAERRFFPEAIRRREVAVGEMIDDYLARVKDKLRSYKECVRAGASWKRALRGKTLRQVLPGDIERYVASRVRAVAPATINRELAFLKRLYHVAMNDGLIDTNPVKRVKFFKENNRRVRWLSAAEEKRLRKAIGEKRWPVVAFALQTGFRRSNQFALRWTDVNFDAGIVTARNPKSGEDYAVPMTDTLRALLRAYPSRLKSEWVFVNAVGTGPIDAQNFRNQVFLPALTKAKIEAFRWHDLRHTFGSRLAMAGVDLVTIQQLMGHKTLEMTLRYAHLSPEHRLHAIRRLDPATGTTTGTKGRARNGKKKAVGEVRASAGKSQRARGESNTQPTDSKRLPSGIQDFDLSG